MRGDRNSAGRTKFQRLPDIKAVVNRIQSDELDPLALGQTGGNPDSVRVKSLLKSLGVPNVFANVQRAFEIKWGGPTAKTFVPDTLDIIVRRRHTVAHTASALMIARTDLRDANVFLVLLTDVLDAAIDRHFARVISAAQ